MELSFDTVLGKTSCCKNFKSVTAIHFFLRFKSLNRLKNANEFFNSSILYTLQNSYSWTTQTKNSPCTLSNSNTTFIHQQWWYHETFSLTGIQFICLKGPWTRKDRKIKKRRSCNYIQNQHYNLHFQKDALRLLLDGQGGWSGQGEGTLADLYTLQVHLLAQGPIWVPVRPKSTLNSTISEHTLASVYNTLPSTPSVNKLFTLMSFLPCSL